MAFEVELIFERGCGWFYNIFNFSFWPFLFLVSGLMFFFFLFNGFLRHYSLASGKSIYVLYMMIYVGKSIYVSVIKQEKFNIILSIFTDCCSFLVYCVSFILFLQII
jgi:hypothetical protein